MSFFLGLLYAEFHGGTVYFGLRFDKTCILFLFDFCRELPLGL
jgi:hypothetical protein